MLLLVSQVLEGCVEKSAVVEGKTSEIEAVLVVVGMSRDNAAVARLGRYTELDRANASTLPLPPRDRICPPKAKSVMHHSSVIHQQ